MLQFPYLPHVLLVIMLTHFFNLFKPFLSEWTISHYL